MTAERATRDTPRRASPPFPRLLVALGTSVALLVPGAVVSASVPSFGVYGYVEAEDWTAGTISLDEIDLWPWPSSTSAWTPFVSAGSSGPTGDLTVGAYQISATSSQSVRPTFVAGDLASVELDASVRVETSVTGCEPEDGNCWAGGDAGTDLELGFEVVGTSRVRLMGTVTQAHANTGADRPSCIVSLVRTDVARVEYVETCTDDSGPTLTADFDQLLEAGRYRLAIDTHAISNAYAYLPTGFAGVVANLRLEVEGASQPGVVDFDWTVPDNFGFDEDGQPGLVDYYGPDGPLDAAHDAYVVDFVAEDSAPCDTTRLRTWSIDGVMATGEAAETGPCSLSYSFPAEGVHDVTLEVRTADGSLVGASTREVTVQDWLIVSIGDSVASGEGNPDIPGTVLASETWQDQQCHRTATAGPAQAAALLERADPKTSVTFVHLACSGATIASGLIGAYTGVEEGLALPPQLDEIRPFTGGREIDAIAVSIGANDVHFAGIVEKCLLQPSCHLSYPGSAARFFDQKVAHLPAWYEDLQSGFTDRDLDPSRVFITQYFDPTRADAGVVCPDGTILGDAPIVGPGTLSPQISMHEAEWASNGLLVRLDQEIRSAASAHGWHFVDGIREPYLRHGYCAGDSWVVKITESFLKQGDKNGALHPNPAGHEFYGQRIAADLTAELYTDGDLSKPRPPSD